jgi:hypothetical protein
MWRSVLRYVIYAKIVLALFFGSCVTAVTGLILIGMIITGEIRQVFMYVSETLILVAFCSGIYLLVGGVTSLRELMVERRSSSQGLRSSGVSSRDGCVVTGVRILLGIFLMLIGSFLFAPVVAGGVFNTDLFGIGFVSLSFLLSGLYLLRAEVVRWGD